MEGSFREDLVIPASVSGGTAVTSKWTAPDEVTMYASPTPFSPYSPLVCSSSLELESWPSVVWDVNWYYWVLGVHFRATRRQLREGYQAQDGADDDYLTYVFSQLLDPAVRRAYDAKPLGSVFWDKYIEQKVRARAHRLALQHQVDADEILKQWGFAEPEEIADEEADGARLDMTQKPGKDEVTSPGGSYTFYIWRTKTYLLSESDLQLARQWRQAILDECYHDHVTTQFAVGIMGAPRRGSNVAMLSLRGATVLFVSTTVDVNDINHLAKIARNLLTT